jgi:glycosyltransferase involved in cell wall biosynthesis
VPIQIGIWRELRRLRPDVIICEGASHMAANVTAYIYSKVYGIPQIQWGLGRLRGRRQSRIRLLMDILFFRRIERSSSAVIAYSSFGADYYRGIGLPTSSIFTAVNTVDTDRRIHEMRTYCTENGLQYPLPVPRKFKVAFIGAMTEGKSVDLLIEAFSRLAKANADAELVLIGDGDDRKRLERMVELLGLGSRIFFSGHRLDSIADLLFDANVVVLPGLGGLAISDAMAHGLPVICHSGDGSELDLIDGTNGRILNVMTPDFLFEELLSLSNDFPRQTQWRANAQRTVVEKYGIGAYVMEVRRAIAYSLSTRKT